ncbi:MAG TPA: four helix bundle protein [Thermoanaerobaculia bacterium]|nr:four helix bundle protein [Thermoanaerobaculia bacterium]
MPVIDIHERSFRFACRIVKLHHLLAPRKIIALSLLNQLLRSGTSIGANLEEAKAGQSKADFIAKCRISLKEARESHYWLRLLDATEIVQTPQIAPLVQESNELVAILTTIVKKASASLHRHDFKADDEGPS